MLSRAEKYSEDIHCNGLVWKSAGEYCIGNV